MSDAVERINAAVDSGESILIFGDRDVDGITATVLLQEALTEMGGQVQWMLPEGEETYGLSTKVIDRAADLGATLLVTVDCGVSNVSEVAYAAEKGIECIVIDHHNPPAELPAAVAVVDPKLPGYPFRDLCGCAVAFKLEWALRFSRSSFFGAPVCLLNARPANETLMIEAVRLVNLVETDRVMENIVPGLVPFEKTRLAGFIDGDDVLVMDAGLHARLFTRAFGPEDTFEVETENAVAGVRGTAFRVNRGTDRATVVKVYAGAVAVANPNVPQAQHKPGERVRVDGPKAVTQKQWEQVVLQQMQAVRVSATGEMEQYAFTAQEEAADAWVLWNQERDAAAPH